MILDQPLLEFWPDYGVGPLWDKAGSAAELDDLDLPGDLAERLRAFNAAYAEDRLPMEGGGDSGYIEEGKRLLSETRAALSGRFRVVVTEPWWGEPPSEHKR